MWINTAWDTSTPRVETVGARQVDVDDDGAPIVELHEFLGHEDVRLTLAAGTFGPEATRLRLTVREGYFGWPYVVAATQVP